MRQTTRKKYYGRSAIAQALRSAAGALTTAIEEAEKPQEESPVAATLRKVVKNLDEALEAEKIYAMNRKRIKYHLERERKNILALIAEVTGVAVLPVEKAAAKRKAEVKK